MHDGAWWIYYREDGRLVRQRIGHDEAATEQMAAQSNAQLSSSLPTRFSFSPVSVEGLLHRFLEHHEHVLSSSLATVRRYREATQHLEDYARRNRRGMPAHEIEPEGFVRHLRTIRVAPNGQPNSEHRKIHNKRRSFILEVCRSLYAYAAKKRHLPPYTENPFAVRDGKRFRVEDSKLIFLFDAESELALLQAADPWLFRFTLRWTKPAYGPANSSICWLRTSI